MIFNLKKQTKFEYIERGEGQAVVLLHGLMGGLSNFQDLENFLVEKKYKVFIPSLPIYSLPILSTSVSGIAKFINKFLKEIVKEPAILIGNSLGGHVGLIVSLKHAKLVKSLVLTGSSGLYEKAFGDSFPKRGNYDYIKQKTQEVFYNPEVATKELIDEVFEIVNDRKKVIKTVTIARSAIRHNMIADLPKIKIPVLLIWGKQDNVTPPEVAHDFNRFLPNSELNLIDECGHAPMMEKPQEFNSILGNWLDKLYN